MNAWPRRIFEGRWFQAGLRLILGAVFLVAGLLKLRHPVEFSDSMVSFDLVPADWIGLVAMTLPWLELFSGCMLILRLEARIASLSISIMTMGFILALGSAQLRGLRIGCGCFTFSPPFPGWLRPQQGDLASIGGGYDSMVSIWFALARDILLLGAGVTVYSCNGNHRRKQPDRIQPLNATAQDRRGRRFQSGQPNRKP